MHNISWRQRKRNLERFFYKRTILFSSSPPAHSFTRDSESFSPQDVSVPPPTSDQAMHKASDDRADSNRKGREVAIQQAKLRAGKKDEAKRLFLPADGAVHGRCPGTPATVGRGRRVDHRAAGEELQSLPKE